MMLRLRLKRDTAQLTEGMGSKCYNNSVLRCINGQFKSFYRMVIVHAE
jgi:hypothetical protein